MIRAFLRLVSLALLLVIGVAGPSVSAFHAAAAWASAQDPAAITVYVTRTGAKYHRATCRYLATSKIPMSLKEAAKRFDPCKVCRPPVL